MSQTKRDAAAELWRICFGDSEPFISLYFREVFREEDTLLRYDATGKPVAHVQMLPYRLHLFGDSIPAGYISGACTHPDYRSGGLMRTLMRDALTTMYERGDVCSFLIPAESWLYDYYARTGDYAPAFGRERVMRHRHAGDGALPAGYTCTKGQGDYDFFRAAEVSLTSCGVLHSRSQWQMACADLSLAGGGVATLRDENGQTVAEAYYVPTADALDIKMLVGEEPATALLTDYLLTDGDWELASILVHSDAAPYGMLRILRLLPVLEVFARKNKTVLHEFVYIDERFPQNNGVYRIADGGVSFSSEVQEADTIRLRHYSPSSLVSEFFTPFPSALFLMLD